MAFSYTPPMHNIKFAGGSIDLRGLSVPDIVQLVNVHMENATKIYQMVIDKDAEGFSEDQLHAFMFKLLAVSPSFVGHVIALSADATDMIDEIGKLPADVQVAALEKIAGITFAMQGGAKNFVETVTRIAQGVSGLNQNVKLPSN
jgi:hypothetical protein